MRAIAERQEQLSALDARLRAAKTAPEALQLEVRRMEAEVRRRSMELARRSLGTGGRSGGLGGRRTILVRLGQTAGTQFAVVLEEQSKGLRVTGWRVSSREWTQPKLVPPEKIFAPSARGDKRWRKALECWPPHWMRERPRHHTPK